MGELKQQMLNMLKIKGYSERTQKTYLDYMEKYTAFHMVSPDKLGKEDIYAYQTYLVNKKNVCWSTFNINVCAIRFFYNHVLNRKWLIEHIPFQKKEKNYLPF